MKGRIGIEWWIAAVAFVALWATSPGYGTFRDELYYLDCARQLDWGYVDHPPLSILMLAVVRSIFGESLWALRLLPSLAAALAVGLTGSLARRCGGGSFAAALAAVAVALAPGVLALSGFYSMNAFDLVFWAGLWWLAALALTSDEPRDWVLFGLVAGLGLQNKISVLFLGFGVAVGLLAARRWDHLRSRWLWLGGGLAFLLFLPHLVWQVAHGWPTVEFMANAARFKNVSLAPHAFLAEFALFAGPIALPLWLVGAWVLLFPPRTRMLRPLGWAFVAVLAVMLLTNSKPYYLLGVLPLLFAAGAAAVDRWTAGPRGRRWRIATLAALVVGNLAVAPMARPLLPVEQFVRYAQTLGIMPSSGERHEIGRLPQHYADMHGWQELAREVHGVWQQLSPAERERACVFTENYGQAGAVRFFWPGDEPAPPVISGHNNHWLWGPRGCSGEVLLVLGDDRDDLDRLFAEVELGAVHDCELCMPYEDEKPIWVVRGPDESLAEFWPRTKHFN